MIKPKTSISFCTYSTLCHLIRLLDDFVELGRLELLARVDLLLVMTDFVQVRL